MSTKIKRWKMFCRIWRKKAKEDSTYNRLEELTSHAKNIDGIKDEDSKNK